MKNIVFILLTIMVLSGCLNTGEEFNVEDLTNAPEDSALVYFYTPSTLCGITFSFKVLANDTEIGTVYNGTYFKRILQPGPYEIYSSNGDSQLFIFNKGETYFVRSFIEITLRHSSIKFSLVNKDIAMVEMGKIKILLD